MIDFLTNVKQGSSKS